MLVVIIIIIIDLCAGVFFAGCALVQDSSIHSRTVPRDLADRG